MQKRQDGFAAQGALILLLVVTLVVGAGYVVMKRQNKESDSTSTASTVSQVKEKIVPVDGTPKSVATEINNQVAKEVKLDDDSMKEEESESKIDDSVVKEVEDSADEKNL